jgi:hypothetical protein
MRLPGFAVRNLFVIAIVSVSCAHSPAPASTAPASASSAADRSWVARSNDNTQLLIDVTTEFEPEYAAREGVPGIDDHIFDFSAGARLRHREALARALTTLQSRRPVERDPLVAQDLDILIAAAKREIRGSELEERLMVRYENLQRRIFGWTRSLLDPQVAPERRPAALVRIRKYAGLEPGHRPVVELIEQQIEDGLARGLMPPARIEIERDLETAPALLDGLAKLFAQFPVAGADEPLRVLRQQLEGYLDFVHKRVLPRARDDFRLPPELYAFTLEEVGVDIPPAELARRAHQAFTEYQAEMQTVAARIAKARHLPSSDYRDVIRELKKQQIPDDDVLAFYQKRLGDIEAIARAQHLVTLPSRPARIRIGTPGENAQQPAPHMIAPASRVSSCCR